MLAGTGTGTVMGMGMGWERGGTVCGDHCGQGKADDQDTPVAADVVAGRAYVATADAKPNQAASRPIEMVVSPGKWKMEH